MLVLCTTLGASAQYTTSDLSLSAGASGWYDEQIGVYNTPIIEGSYYPIVVKAIYTHPYYKVRKWSPGKMQFKSQNYEVLVMYDIFEDIVVIQNSTTFETMTQPLKPPQHHIESFEFLGSKFVRIISDQMRDGFYEELYKGESIGLYAKRRKTSRVDEELVFKEENKRYLRFDDKWSEVRNRKSLIKVFSAYKSEIKKFCREGNLFYGRNPEPSLKMVAEHLDQLISDEN